MKKKAEYFLEDKRKIHISLKSGKFYNGFIVEIRNEFLIFEDAVLSKVPIWYEDIKEGSMEPFKELGE